VSGQLHAPAALPPGKDPWNPLDRRLGGPQNRSGHGGEEKNSQPTPGIEPSNPDRPARSPALYRLSYHGSELKLVPKNVHTYAPIYQQVSRGSSVGIATGLWAGRSGF
jgi:hypothetical protein